MNTSFFGELLQTISERGRSLLDRTRERRGLTAESTESLVDLCEELLSNRGEASGVALAREILARYADLTIGARIAFLESLATNFGIDHARITAATQAWHDMPSDAAAAEPSAADRLVLDTRRQAGRLPGALDSRRHLHQAAGGPRYMEEMGIGTR